MSKSSPLILPRSHPPALSPPPSWSMVTILPVVRAPNLGITFAFSLPLTGHSLPSPFRSFQKLPDWFVNEAIVSLPTPLLSGLVSPSPQSDTSLGWPTASPVAPHPVAVPPTTRACSHLRPLHRTVFPQGITRLYFTAFRYAQLLLHQKAFLPAPHHSNLQPAWLSLLVSECKHSTMVMGPIWSQTAGIQPQLHD